ncbi:MAG: hypothetical protein WC028_14770 [Candidatus Obscuribacterales bacterium]
MSQQYRAKSSIKEITAAISLISLFTLQGLGSPAQAQNFNSIFEPGGSSSNNYPSNPGGNYTGGSYNGGYGTPPESDFGNYGTGGNTGNTGGYGTNYGNTGNTGSTGANPNYTPVNTPSMWDTILEKLMGKSKSPGEFIVFPKDVPLAKGAGGQTDTTNRASNTNGGVANDKTYKQSLMESQNQNRASSKATNFSTGQQWGNVRATSANGDGNFTSGGVIGPGTGTRSGGVAVTGNGNGNGTGANFSGGSSGLTGGSNNNMNSGQNMGQTNFNQIFENGGNQGSSAQRTTSPATQSTYDPKSVQANFAGINSQVQGQLTQTQNYANSARNSLNQAMSSTNSSAIQQAASEARSHANAAQAAAESASSLASTTSSPMAKTLANQAREQAAQAMNYADQAMAKASASY